MRWLKKACKLLPHVLLLGMQKDQQSANKRRSQAAAEVWNQRKAEIEWLYIQQQWPQIRMANYFGICQAAIQKVMIRLGITARDRANYGERNGRYKDGSQSRLYRLMIQKDKCSDCGATDMLLIHHKNFDHFDNHLENLQVLCSPCHSRLHKKEWWRRKKSQS